MIITKKYLNLNFNNKNYLQYRPVFKTGPGILIFKSIKCANKNTFLQYMKCHIENKVYIMKNKILY